MTLHPQEVAELSGKKPTLGKYLVDKIGGRLKGEEGDVKSYRLEIEISEAPQTNLEAVKKHIIDFYKNHGFKVKYNQDFGIHFVDKEERLRAMAVSYFGDIGMIRVSAVKIGPK